MGLRPLEGLTDRSLSADTHANLMSAWANLRANIRRRLETGQSGHQSQADLAKALKITPSHLNDFLQARKGFTTKALNLDVIASFLGTDVPSLFRALGEPDTRDVPSPVHQAAFGLLRMLTTEELEGAFDELSAFCQRIRQQRGDRSFRRHLR